MTVAQLQRYTFASKYARFNAALGRRETWDESVDRVFGMHEARFAHLPQVSEDIAFAKEAVRDRLVLGSQRALQFGGKPIEDKNARLYNCTVSYCDRARFFQESLWLLLCGCGVGFSVQKHHIARLPMIAKPKTTDRVSYVIEDTIEGWSDALGVLVSAYFTTDQSFPEFAGRTVAFDFSKIRPKGAVIASGVGKAPGPEPLRQSLEHIRQVLDRVLSDAGSPTRLRSIDAYDMVMHASDAVLAGGVRRSATICLFSLDDQEMITAKTGDWYLTNPQRGRSNNSAVLLRSETTFAQFEAIMQSTRQFGEPGFVWADSTEIMFNPCCEIGMFPVDPQSGMSGWAFCNLCEINMKACETPEIFARACRAAAILGTLQASYTRFPYLGDITERIVRHEALLGCSMTGMMDNPAIAFDPVLQERMARLILDVNATIAEKIGINPTARATCVKPAGTTSCILGTASGIHPHHSRRYFRRVQATASDEVTAYFQAHNPRAIEKSVWSRNKTDVVATFCCEAPEQGLVKAEVTAVDLLERVKLTQQHWVNAGRREERCRAAWLSHNVSNTITVRDHEWEDVTRYIFENRAHFAGISLLSDGGDLDYPQAPFVSVLTHEEILTEYGVGSLFASGLIVDGLHAFADDLWKACACALGVGERLEIDALGKEVSEADLTAYQERVRTVLARRDWVRRASKFAANYFGGDVRRMSYCLKRVHTCKQWEDLTREFQPVDYSMLLETRDNTTLEQTVACGGGKCDIIAA